MPPWIWSMGLKDKIKRAGLIWAAYCPLLYLGGRCIYRKDPYVLEFTGLSELAKYSETDLVFFNRLLRCFVQMYVNYYDGTVKLKDENPTKESCCAKIGMIQ